MVSTEHTHGIRVSCGLDSYRAVKKTKARVTCHVAGDDSGARVARSHREDQDTRQDSHTHARYRHSSLYLTKNQQAPLRMADCTPLCLFSLQLMVIWLTLPGPGLTGMEKPLWWS